MSETQAGGARPFEQLHPAVQHHVVNTLGWRSLRPHQEAAIAPILRGEHVLVQAPTAGGKTESAVLPILSRMLQEGWGQPSTLYLCPIKALLNNLESRLTLLAGMVGRSVAVWHGDVEQSERKRILRERPDILLATPESVEVMLVSRAVDHRALFAGLRAVIVDEVHAFAGDDRGWHLLSLVERIAALADGHVQRIALSATLSNPEELLSWLTARRDEPQTVVRGASAPASEAEVIIDAVGSLENAASVISRLHHGEKRLVFCDSRRQVEELAQLLRSHGVRTFVSHSSLGVDERRQAERAFAEGSDCVIVATSTLELGIDVGDLDRVIQIDAPLTVAGFLQRLGRTGRRAGTRRNCLFLATDDEALLRACALVSLWSVGFVEPVQPPALPYPVLAQQVLAILLQQGGGTDRHTLRQRLARWCATAGISLDELDAVLTYLLDQGVLFTDGPIIGIGPAGERAYGARHFLELFSVFNTPPLVTVLHGVHEIGQVHPLSFQSHRDDEPAFIVLAGHGWRVTHLSPDGKKAWVEPSSIRGKSRWIGDGPPMHFELAQAVAKVLVEGLEERFLSRRSRETLLRLRDEYSWVRLDTTTLISDAGGTRARWWTFAGDRYDQAVGAELTVARARTAADALGVTVQREGEDGWMADTLRGAVMAARDEVARSGGAWRADSVRKLKFAECVPEELLGRMARARFGVRASGEVLARRVLLLRLETT